MGAQSQYVLAIDTDLRTATFEAGAGRMRQQIKSVTDATEEWSAAQRRINSQIAGMGSMSDNWKNQIATQAQARADLENRTFRANASPDMQRLRDNSDYYDSLRIKFAGNEGMLTLIKKAQTAERNAIVKRGLEQEIATFERGAERSAKAMMSIGGRGASFAERGGRMAEILERMGGHELGLGRHAVSLGRVLMASPEGALAGGAIALHQGVGLGAMMLQQDPRKQMEMLEGNLFGKIGKLGYEGANAVAEPFKDLWEGLSKVGTGSYEAEQRLERLTETLKSQETALGPAREAWREYTKAIGEQAQLSGLHGFARDEASADQRRDRMMAEMDLKAMNASGSQSEYLERWNQGKSGIDKIYSGDMSDISQRKYDRQQQYEQDLADKRKSLSEETSAFEERSSKDQYGKRREEIIKEFDELKKRAQDLGETWRLPGLRRAMHEQLVDAYAELSPEGRAKAYNKELEQQIQLFGRIQGMSKVTEAANAGTPALELQKMYNLTMKLEGLRVSEQFATPMQKFAKSYADLKELFDAGAIDKGTLNRGLMSAAKSDFQGLGQHGTAREISGAVSLASLNQGESDQEILQKAVTAMLKSNEYLAIISQKVGGLQN